MFDLTTVLGYMNSEDISRMYYEIYCEVFGKFKGDQISSTIDFSPQVNKFIDTLLEDEMYIESVDFIKTVDNIPFFKNCTGEDLCCGILLLIRKWEDLSQDEYLPPGQPTLKRFIINTIEICEKIRPNSKVKFFSTYKEILELLYVKTLRGNIK